MARRAMGWLLMLFTLGLVGCDHATKAAAHVALGSRGAIPIVPGVLDLRYAENRDTAFSLLAGLHIPGKMAILGAISLVMLVVVLVTWWRRRRSASGVEQLAYALVAAGAAGNAIDRLFQGYVVDFIHLHHWPVFNVADIALVIGAILFAIASSRRPHGETPSSA